MPRIITPPDLEFDRTIKRFLIRNCPWDDALLETLAQNLSDKLYDIYIYRDEMNDIQWFEGIRTSAYKIYDYRDYKHRDPLEWLNSLDEEIK